MIDDSIVYEGDYVDNFKVVAIKADRVELFAEEMKFILGMQLDE